MQSDWMHELAIQITLDSTKTFESSFKANQYGLPLYVAIYLDYNEYGRPIFLMLCSEDLSKMS